MRRLETATFVALFLLILTPAAVRARADAATQPSERDTAAEDGDAADPAPAEPGGPPAAPRDGAAATYREAVEVVARPAGYAPPAAVDLGKGAAPLLETPRAVSIVGAEQIRDLGAQGLQEALNYAAGVRSDAFGLDSRTDSALVRGGSPDEYLDGTRQAFNYYTSTTRTDPYALERIAVLRGPASVLFGQGTTAGVIDMVSKRPRATPHHEVVLQGGSFERVQARADLTGPLSADGRWLYRVVALARGSGTQVDAVPDDRSLFAPALTWRPDDRTTVTLLLRWQDDHSGSTLQFLPWSGTGAPNPNGRIPTDTFLGEPGFDRYDSQRATAGWLFERAIGHRWRLRQNVRWARNEVDYRSLYGDAFSSPGDSFLDAERRRLGRYLWISQPEVEMWTADQGAEVSFTTGRARHVLGFGLDLVSFRQSGRTGFDLPQSLGGGVPPIDVYDPEPTGITPPDLAADPRSRQEQGGLYVLDRVRVGERWVVTAGLRHDRVRSALEGHATEKDAATTGSVAVLFDGPGGWAPYVSYAESFTPVAGTNLAGVRFEPLAGSQVEAGVKVEAADGALLLTAAAFEIRERNRLVTDPANPIDQIQAGRTRTTGLELEAQGTVGLGIDLTAHYNYLDNDRALDAVPANQAALWARRGFFLGGATSLVVGLGLRRFDSFRDGAAPVVPAVTLADALLAVEIAGRYRIAANVSNLADETYVATCLARGDCFYGARRTVVLSGSVQF